MADNDQLTIDGKRPFKITLKVAITGGFGEEEFSKINGLMETIEAKVKEALPQTRVEIKI